MDTIFATATAPGRAGLSVIRISGPLAFVAAERLAGRLPAHGRALRQIAARDGVVIDEALILTFAEGRSFTGEATVELHLHGSGAVVAAVSQELQAMPGLRLAEAGEFTRRAMENGRLDIAQAEGLADLLDAETEAQRRQAMRVFRGAMGALSDGWRTSLLRAASLLEATIDFADEDVPVDVGPEVQGLLDDVLAALVREIAGVPVAERVRNGFEVALVGRPNVGKSTLLNYLVGREAAITSATPGTTRDVIEVRVDIAGIAVTFLDTAGRRDGLDEIERIGIARGQARAEAADLRVHLVEAGDKTPSELLADDIVVVAKADGTTEGGGGVSGRTGAGVHWLLARIGNILTERVGSVGSATTERHRRAMEEAATFIRRAIEILRMEREMPELAAVEVRAAMRSLDSLVGRVDVEEVLGEIFSRFCIGK